MNGLVVRGAYVWINIYMHTHIYAYTYICPYYSFSCNNYQRTGEAEGIHQRGDWDMGCGWVGGGGYIYIYTSILAPFDIVLCVSRTITIIIIIIFWCFSLGGGVP